MFRRLKMTSATLFVIYKGLVFCDVVKGFCAVKKTIMSFALLSLAAVLLAACNGTATPPPGGAPTEAPVVIDATPTPEVVEPGELTTPTSAEDAGGEADIAALVAAADPAHGEELFNTRIAAVDKSCSGCHDVTVESGRRTPSFRGLATRAATRIEGMSAIDYLYQSITSPDAFVVEGFRDDLMPETYAEVFTGRDIADIIAYLLTLQN